MNRSLQDQLADLSKLIKLRQFDEAMAHLQRRADKEREERLRRAMMPSDREDWADVDAVFLADRPVDSGVWPQQNRL